jgi:hypothetical protein
LSEHPAALIGTEWRAPIGSGRIKFDTAVAVTSSGTTKGTLGAISSIPQRPAGVFRVSCSVGGTTNGSFYIYIKDDGSAVGYASYTRLDWVKQ